MCVNSVFALWQAFGVFTCQNAGKKMHVYVMCIMQSLLVSVEKCYMPFMHQEVPNTFLFFCKSCIFCVPLQIYRELVLQIFLEKTLIPHFEGSLINLAFTFILYKVNVNWWIWQLAHLHKKLKQFYINWSFSCHNECILYTKMRLLIRLIKPIIVNQPWLRLAWFSGQDPGLWDNLISVTWKDFRETCSACL